MQQDIPAARVVFDSGCPLVQLPCRTVVSAFYTTKPELEYWIKGKNPLCDYLYEHTVEATDLHRYVFDENRPFYCRVTFIHRDALFGEVFRVLAE